MSHIKSSNQDSDHAIPYWRIAPLFMAQAISTGALTVSTILASIIMGHLGQPTLMGLPATLMNVSATLSASLFGWMMLRYGRRLGLGLAFLLGAFGSVVGFLGGKLGLVPLFLIGAVIMGAAQSGAFQARYAVIESVPASKRGSTLGLLMLMSVAGSFMVTGLSDQIENWAKQLQTTPEIMGWLVGGSILLLGVVCMVIWRPLKPPSEVKAAQKLSFKEAISVPGVRSTALALALGHGLMVTLMTLTPMRAHDMGLDHGQVAHLISGHILGMYGFGWLTGPMIDRIGIPAGYILGAILLIVAAVTSPLETAAWLGFSMFLLGLGWNLAFVSGSKSMAHFPAAQGVADSLGYLLGGSGTLFGGMLVATAGFPVLVYVCTVLSCLLLVSAWRAVRLGTTPSISPRAKN